jgi:hypothetical protein
MLTDIHEIVRRLLYEEGRISPRDVAIEFRTPTREVLDRDTRPTINCFLFGMHENGDLRQTSFQATRVNGRSERRLPPRRFDLHYMVSTHATEPEDEHRLLWRALATLLRFPELPAAMFPEELRDLPVPLATRTGQEDDSRELPGLWSTLNVEPHPAIAYVITAPLDTELTISSPLVLTRTLRFARSLDGSTEETHIEIGGIVRGRDGAPVAGAVITIEGSAAEGCVTNTEGEFTLRGVPPGSVRLHVTSEGHRARTVSVSVPSDTYDIVLR